MFHIGVYNTNSSAVLIKHSKILEGRSLAYFLRQIYVSFKRKAVLNWYFVSLCGYRLISKTWSSITLCVIVLKLLLFRIIHEIFHVLPLFTQGTQDQNSIDSHFKIILWFVFVEFWPLQFILRRNKPRSEWDRVLSQ